MPTRFTRLLPFLAFLAALACVLPAAAQVSGIRGKATDSNGKPIVGATVLFHRKDIEGTWKVQTNKHGDYGHYGLPLGEYTVKLISPSGKLLYAYHNVKTRLGNPLRINFNLKKLAVQQTKGMSAAQLAAYKKALAHNLKVKAENAKIGQLNQLLKQNHAFAVAGNWQQAIQTMQQAAAMDQTHSVIFGNLGDDYTGAKQWPQAAQAYQKAIALKPNGGAYYVNLGNALAHENQTQQAMAAFTKGVQMDPTQSKVAYLNEAVIFFNSNHPNSAITAANKAIAADPTNVKAWYIKGMALMNKVTVDPKTNMPVAAPGTRTAFKKVLALAPNSGFAAQAKVNLDTLNTKVQTNYSH